jgi:EAL domain-containing protein (putative c-di-GMP-specific phosphodiesterase class I)
MPVETLDRAQSCRRIGLKRFRRVADARKVTPAIDLTPGTVRVVPDLGLEGGPHLVFQPTVDLASGRLRGFGALLRWTDAVGGSIAPDVVISRAEDRGQVAALAAWALAEACSQAATWSSNLRLTVDGADFGLRREEAALAAAAALKQTGLDPDRLTVEVAEIAVGGGAAATDGRAVSRLGVQVTPVGVDSDWAVLEMRPGYGVKTLKIDGSLVAALVTDEGSSRTIIETIVEVTRALDVSTVAEAVATADQVAILRALGVDVAQGLFFSPPLTAADAGAFSAMSPLPSFALAEAAVPAPVVDAVHPSVTGRTPTLVAPVGPTELFADALVLAEPTSSEPVPVRGVRSPVPSDRGTASANDDAAEPFELDDPKIRQVGQALLELITAVERQNELIESWLNGASLPVHRP